MPRDEWVSVDGLRLHYRDWGGSGEPVILIHGLASTCHIWDLVAPILSERFAVLALDQRGHGESEKPDRGYDFATVAGDLRKFIEAVGVDRPILVGHSWGGNVAVEFAATYPAMAKGLCLIDGGTIEVSAVPGMTLERAREEMAPPDFTGTTVDQFRAMGRSRDWGFEITPEIEQIVIANFEVLEDNTIRARLSRKNHMEIINACWDQKPSTLYSKVACPTLLMPTRKDSAAEGWRASFDESIAKAEQLLPVSKTAWLEDSIHDVPLQRPELVADTIEEHILNGFFD